MNLAHYRKSKYSKEETIKKVKESANEQGFNLLGEIELKKADATLLQLCKDEWLDAVISADKNLVGLMPCGFLVTEKDGEVSVGIGNPAVMGGVTRSHDIVHLASEAETTLKKMLSAITGTEDPKPTGVKLYSTQTCPYCKMEKQWLDSNDIDHEVIYVDQDQEAAQRMVQETGQMGVPVTEIVYDNDDKEFIIGFDKEKLSSILI